MKKNIVIYILALGVFSIINTEMGIIGILPLISSTYQVRITDAGLMVSLFALAVAVAGPTMPLLCSKMNRKKAMMIVLGIFTICNLVAAFAPNFTIALLARVIPAFFHPIYVSLALTVAQSSVDENDAPKAISKVLLGVSAGMVIGVPIVSFIANATTLRMAMLFFALINAVAFLLTIICIPSLQAEKTKPYVEQLHYLKKLSTWISIIAVVCLNGAIFGVYSYLTEFLSTITKLSENVISMMLLIYGLANMIGNMMGGKQLSKRPIRFTLCFPILLIGVYVILFLLGEFSFTMACLLLLWGILAGAAGNINQYWITSVLPDAPEFGNGLFLAATNLGTTLGTTLCGFIIMTFDLQYMIIGGLLLLILGMALIIWRVIMFSRIHA